MWTHSGRTPRRHWAAQHVIVTSDRLSNSLLPKTLPFEVSVHDVCHEHVHQVCTCSQELHVGTDKHTTKACITVALPTFSFPSPPHPSASVPPRPAFVSFATSVCYRSQTQSWSWESDVFLCDAVFFCLHYRSCTVETCSFAWTRLRLWAFSPLYRETWMGRSLV